MKRTQSSMLLVGALLASATASAQQPIKVNGKYLQKPIAFDAPAAKVASSPVALFLAAEFTFRGGGIFDGARGVVSGMGDVLGDVILVRGVTSHEKAGGTYVDRFSGHCVNGKSGGNAIMMCGGDWYTLPGATGQFAGIVASGTWKGVVTPEGNFDAEFDGMYTK